MLQTLAFTTAFVPMAVLGGRVEISIRQDSADDAALVTKKVHLNVVPSAKHALREKHYDALLKQNDERKQLRAAKKVALPPKVKATVAVPDYLDLSANIMPIQDQGNLGSCTANAAQGLMDVEYRLRGLLMPPISRLFEYAGSRVIDNTDYIMSSWYPTSSIAYSLADDSGATIAATIKSLLDFGTVPESFYPYDITKFQKNPAGNLFYLAQLFADVLPVAAAPVDQTVESIKVRLAKGKSVIIGMSCYEGTNGILSSSAAVSGMVGLPSPMDEMQGGHAVLLVGYDDRPVLNGQQNSHFGHFKVRNSWSTAWGDQGYFYLPYSYVTNPDLTWELWSFVSDTDPALSSAQQKAAMQKAYMSAVGLSLAVLTGEYDKQSHELESLKVENAKLKARLDGNSNA